VVEWLDEPPADPVPVHPPAYREFLRTAATTEGTVRTTVPALVYDPEPVLPTLDAVELVGGDSDGDGDDTDSGPTGVHAVRGEGDTYYDTSVAAEPVADGGNATDGATSDANVTDVDSLPADRAAFVRRTVREGVEVEPQTERGTWVRESFLGERFRANGTVYRGVERKPTDAEFFATEVWYALELSPDDAAEPGARLDLAPPDRTVADALSGLDRTRLSEGAAERALDPVPDPVVAFAREVGAVGTPTGFYSVSVE
jgi:hypothetical protein